MYIIEYQRLDTNYSKSNIWTSIGASKDFDYLIRIVETKNEFKFKRKNNDWLMNDASNRQYKLHIIQKYSINNEIFEFKSALRDVIYRYKPTCESFLVDTNEVVNIHDEQSSLFANTMRLFEDKNKWRIRPFNPINPWQLNIKDELCTTL